MKLHDLHPASGSRTARTRVGRGIAAGKGKTAGRGTKGQKARSGGSIPAWFEGGQTPIHMRVPKLRGFKNRFKVEYEVVNVGRIAEFAERGRFTEAESHAASSRSSKAAPITVNAAMLREAGLIGSARTPLKVLGAGEVGRPLFVVADAFTRSAREKLEAAGGTAQLIEVPDRPAPALKGVDEAGARAAGSAAAAEAPAADVESAEATPEGEAARPAATVESPTSTAESPTATADSPLATAEAPARRPRGASRRAAVAAEPGAAAEHEAPAEPEAATEPEAPAAKPRRRRASAPEEAE